MSRIQTLVQLSDSLVASLDQRAAAMGVSRSALIRQAVEHFLSQDRDAHIDAELAETYARWPAPQPDDSTLVRAAASIDEEPW